MAAAGRRRNLILALGLLAVACSPAGPAPTPTTPAGPVPGETPSPPACSFDPGIGELARQLGPDVVGTCLEDEHPGPGGSPEQRTGGGLFVREGAIVAFTDGVSTWRACPDGLDRRPAAAPFAGCGAPAAAPFLTATPVPTATRSPTPRPTPEGTAPMSIWDCPGSHPIKAGPTRREGELLYYPPRSASYGLARPARCFANEQDAEAAGYRRGPR